MLIAITLATAYCLGQTQSESDEIVAQVKPRVSNVKIYGNIVTNDAKIRELLNLYPGQMLPSRDEILSKEIALLVAFQKRFDLINHVRPRIVVRGDGPFRDVLLIFPERPGITDDGKPSSRPTLEIDPLGKRRRWEPADR